MVKPVINHPQIPKMGCISNPQMVGLLLGFPTLNRFKYLYMYVYALRLFHIYIYMYVSYSYGKLPVYK